MGQVHYGILGDGVHFETLILVEQPALVCKNAQILATTSLR